MGLLSFVSGLGGGIKGVKYQNKSPAFKLEEFFSGQSRAWGLVQDYTGNVTSRFDIVLNGEWQGNAGTLHEIFTYYEDGKKQERTWKIKRLDELNYEGQAEDIIGTARGRSYGNAINWKYDMEVPLGKGKRIQLQFEDWIWALTEDIVINRLYMRKFGLTVGEISICMQKLKPNET